MPTPIPAPPLVDAAAGTPSLRTLGTGATQAAAGNDSRFDLGGEDPRAQYAAAAGKIPLSDGTTGLIDPDYIGYASATSAGLVTTGDQTFAGIKIFSGRVGIGVADPSVALEVSGMARVVGASPWLKAAAGANEIGLGASGAGVRLATSGTSTLDFYCNGYLGASLQGGHFIAEGMLVSKSEGVKFPDNTVQTTAAAAVDTSKMVTTDTVQTISGAKTFSNTLSLGNGVSAEKLLVYDGPGARYGFGISDFTLRAFTPGASGLEYFNVYYGNTGGFPALSLETKKGDLSVTGKFAAGGDATLSAIGSTFAAPRSFGIIDIGNSPTYAARWFMGDAANGIQLGYGQKLQMYAYHGIEISGGRGDGGVPSFVPGNGASDASLKVVGNAEVTGGLIVPGGASISGSGVGSYSGGPEIHFKTDADHGMARFYPLTGTGKDRFYAYYDSADIANSSQFHTALVKSTGWYTNSPGAYIASTRSGSGATQNLYLVASDYDASGLMDPTKGITLLANTGRVGIGTTTPAEKLEVAGNVKIAGTLTGATNVVTTTDDQTVGGNKTFTTSINVPAVNFGDGTTVRGASWMPSDLPLTSHAADDEFSVSGNLANWTVAASGAIQTVLDPYDTLTGATWNYSYNNHRRGWLMVQPSTGGATSNLFYKALTVTTNQTYFFRVHHTRGSTAVVNNDYSVGVRVMSTVGGVPEQDNSFGMWMTESDAGAYELQAEVYNAGSLTSKTLTLTPPSAIEYGLIHKRGTTIHFWAGSSSGNWYYLGSLSYTNGATLNKLVLAAMNAKSTDPGNAIMGWDFVRVVNNGYYMP